MKNNKLKHGFTLLLSLLVISVILSVGLGVFGIMTKELKLSGMGRESQIAFYAADAGIECFFYWEIKHPDLDDTLFADRTAAVTKKCAGNDINIAANSNGPYNFKLPLSNNSCVKVKVANSGLVTTIESRGYNIDCDSTSPFKVERAIRMVSTKQQGGGVYLPPDSPSNLNIKALSLNPITKATLTWSNSSCGSYVDCSYSLYKSIDGSNFSLVASNLKTNTYEDSGSISTILYNYYYVTASTSNGESTESDIVRATVTNNPTLLTFPYAGSLRSWTVPAGVNNITVGVFGAQGGSSGDSGGLGGFSSSKLSVSPGEIIYIYVGGQKGWNGGGSGDPYGYFGGGASDIRIDTNDDLIYDLGERVIVAGGGGGSGTRTDTYFGGYGGGSIGGDGMEANGVSGGKGATNLGGGVGGYTVPSGLVGGQRTTRLRNSSPGGLGQGGDGGFNNCSAYGGGGGGGGGYYGGGGGGGGCSGGSAGGGGSSFIPNGGITVSGVRSGNGMIGIEY